MRNVVLVLAALAFALTAVAAPFAPEVTAERYPDADAVLVDDVERVAYRPDGSYVQTRECWTKVLTEKGRREESSLTLEYSKRYGSAEIVFVRIIGADGAEREVDVSATTKESTDNSSTASNIYDPLDRRIVCTIPGLQVGETLHVKTMRRADKPRCENQWSDLSVMEWTCPIVRATYEVVAPASRPLKKIAVRNPLGNVAVSVARREDGSTVHTFAVTNSAQAFPEPDMPPLYTQVQNVRVSTAEDWREISRWYWNLCAPHLAKTNAAMVAKTAELAAGRDRANAIAAIFKFVSQEIRYMGLTEEDTSPGYAPHDVDRTFDSRAGVCRDKAGLLAAMLRLVGFEAYPVLIHTGAKLDPEVPQPFFNHAIVAVVRPADEPGSGERPYLLMDPTNENTKDLFPAYLGNCSYLVARPDGDGLRISPVASPELNSLAVESRGRMAKDGTLTLSSDIAFSGINDTAYRGALARQQPADRIKFFERAVRRVAAGAELVSCEIEPSDMRDTSKPVKVRMISRFPESALRGRTRSELNVPFFGRTLGIANFLLRGNTSLDRRKYPLVLDATSTIRETVSVDLADAALGPALELPSSVQNRLSGYLHECRYAMTNGQLEARRTLTVGAVEFSPADYARLREEIKLAEAAERKRPVFAEDGEAEADVSVWLDRSETTVLSEKSWITTNTVVKQVLSYEGKKRSAELKFSYNPAVEMFELVSASVSNRNGSVLAPSGKDVNLLDCGWAASAPRYPAGKLLVANLPAVEIGSVISYTTVRTVTNAPAPFYAAYSFDSHLPLRRKIVRVNDWRREVHNPPRLPDEPNQPAGEFWRDVAIVSSNRFDKLDLRIPRLEDSPVPSPAGIADVRNWMAKYVKVRGPGLYELPLDLQLTDPATVIRERYATRLDYVRTLCALLRHAGYAADVVFSAGNGGASAESRRRIRFDHPNLRAFSAPLCRVKETRGGFLGWGGEERTYFIGTENEYAPLGPTAHEGSDCFEPESGEFGVVTAPSPDDAERDDEYAEYAVRENGSVDLTVESVFWGPNVGALRRKFAEILPEDRSRLFQQMLGAVSQAASATSDLETDVENYPFRQKFSCFIPDLATVQDDALTLQIPELISGVPSFTGSARRTPFAIAAADAGVERVTVRFPEGYTEIECLPEPFTLANPLNPGEIWLESDVGTEVADGVLTVTLTRKVYRRGVSRFDPSFHALVKDWSRIANSRASRTIVVRRRK